MAAQPNVSKQQYQELAEQAAAQLGYTLTNFEFDNLGDYGFQASCDVDGKQTWLPKVSFSESQQMAYAFLLSNFANRFITKNKG